MKWTAKPMGDMTLSIVDEKDRQILKIDMLSYQTMKAGENGDLPARAMNDLTVIANFADGVYEIPPRNSTCADGGCSRLPWKVDYRWDKRRVVIWNGDRKKICEKTYPASFPVTEIEEDVELLKRGVGSINRLGIPEENGISDPFVIERKRAAFYGFPDRRVEELCFEDHDAVIVYPEKIDPNYGPVLKTEYWGAYTRMEEELLKEGLVVCYVKNDNRWGKKEDIDRKARFVKYVAGKCGLMERCLPVGMSCGGIFAVKLAAMHPEAVAGLCLEAPVINYMSCPCGFGMGEKLNDGKGTGELLDALGITMPELLAYRDMPLDHIGELIANRVPVLLAAGDSDTCVPYEENGRLLEKAYRGAGLPIEVQLMAGRDHHPHGAEAGSIVEFAKKIFANSK